MTLPEVTMVPPHGLSTLEGRSSRSSIRSPLAAEGAAEVAHSVCAALGELDERQDQGVRGLAENAHTCRVFLGSRLLSIM